MQESNTIPDELLVEIELTANGIVKQPCGAFLLQVAGDEVRCPFDQCAEICRNELNGLKCELWDAWELLGHLADLIVSEPQYNDSSCLDNLLFLNSVKKAHLFSVLFDELLPVSQSIQKILSCDIAHIDEQLVQQFNEIYVGIKTLHALVMKEIYRCKLLRKYSVLNKAAGISGPWANLDLPMKERVWPWEEDEQWFNERTQARQKQTRYNPEYNMYGVYFEWRDENRNPYRFEDRKTDSPYRSRHQISIP